MRFESFSALRGCLKNSPWLMDAFNENSNEQQEQQPMGCLHRFSKTIKVVIIGLLILLLMIPMFMIENLISERGRTQEKVSGL